jgi:chlorophyllase
MALANDKTIMKFTTSALPLFEVGKLNVKISTQKSGNGGSLPPKEILIASPTDGGLYPVVLFIHGFFLRNYYYTQLLTHISSHGYIVVAPQVSFIIFLFGVLFIVEMSYPP